MNIKIFLIWIFGLLMPGILVGAEKEPAPQAEQQPAPVAKQPEEQTPAQLKAGLDKCKADYGKCLARQQSLLNTTKHYMQENKELKARMQDLEGSKGIAKAEDKIEELRMQLDMLNKANEYVFYKNKRDAGRARLALKNVDRLISLHPEGDYVQNIKDVTSKYSGANQQTRKQLMNELMSIKDTVLKELLAVQKQLKKKKDEGAATQKQLVQPDQPQENKPAESAQVGKKEEKKPERKQVAAQPKQQESQEEDEDED